MQARHDYHQALFNGQVEEVITAIKEGAVDPNEVNSDGVTLLQAAAQEGKNELVLWLLLRGAEVDGTTDKKTKTPFQYAWINGYNLTAHLLVTCGANKHGVSMQIDKRVVNRVLFWFVSHYRSTDSLDLFDKIISNVTHSKRQVLIQGLTELAAFLNHPLLAVKLFNQYPVSRLSDTICPPAYWAVHHNDMQLFKSLAPNKQNIEIALWHLKDRKNPNYHTILASLDNPSEMENCVDNLTGALPFHLAEFKNVRAQRSYQSLMQGNNVNIDMNLVLFLHRHFDCVAIHCAVEDDLQPWKFAFCYGENKEKTETMILHDKLSQWMHVFSRNDQFEFIKRFPNDSKVALVLNQIFEDRLSNQEEILRLREIYFKQFFISYLLSQQNKFDWPSKNYADIRKSISDFVSDQTALRKVNKDFYMMIRLKNLPVQEFQRRVIPKITADITRELREQENIQDLRKQALAVLDLLDNHMEKEGCYKLKVRKCEAVFPFLVGAAITAVFTYFYIILHKEAVASQSNIDNSRSNIIDSLRHYPQPKYDNLSCLDYLVVGFKDHVMYINDDGKCVANFPYYAIIDSCVSLCKQLNNLDDFSFAQVHGFLAGLIIFSILACCCFPLVFDFSLDRLSRSDATLPNNLLEQVKKIITNDAGLDWLSAKEVRDELSQFVNNKSEENLEKEKTIADKNTVSTMIHKHLGLFSLPQVPVVRREFHRIDIAESKEEDISLLREPLLSVQRGYGSMN